MEPEIHRAARCGDLQTLQYLVDAGADINIRADVPDGDPDLDSDLQQLTPLMIAARSSDGAGVETLAWLLDHGADLHAVSRSGGTAAWYAAGKGGRPWWRPWRPITGHAESLRLLLDAGCDPNEAGGGGGLGRTLLVEACSAGDPSIVALLLERGASPERDQYPLFAAVKSGSLACVELLLAWRGGNGDRGDKVRLDGIDKGDDDVLDEALSQEDYLGVAGHGETEGSWLVMDPEGPDPRYFAIAQRLLGVGVPLERADTKGRSRLYRAAFASQDGAVAFLLERGASLAPHADGETPLHAICWHGSSTPLKTAAWQRIIRRLVAAGAPLEGEPSPLLLAIYGDVPCPESVATLLELGADPNARDEDGETPLHYAVRAGSLECVHALLEQGGDLWSRDSQGQTPLDVARSEAMQKAVLSLMSVSEPYL